MHLSYCAYLVVFVSFFTEAFFLFGEEPILFCIKVCPLYCSPRKRRDADSSQFYWDEPPFISDGHIIDHFPPSYHDPYFFCKPPTKPAPTTTTTTTTMAPTTEEPTWICMVCLKKCNYPKKT
ncbi:uncharacterized protein [Epargyreus clarus]|uniref:uncharacterized protein n=1 Tax=Epargyreus clarus TaxID=520877 RepID=UPI003C2EA3BE